MRAEEGKKRDTRRREEEVRGGRSGRRKT